jgi:hypothetical protein
MQFLFNSIILMHLSLVETISTGLKKRLPDSYFIKQQSNRISQFNNIFLCTTTK